MPNLNDKFYNLTKNTKTNVYIETGSCMGEGIKRVLDNYDIIHSIELSSKWYNYCKTRFSDNKNVTMHLGDSSKVLPELLSTIDEPVTLFLDAHYSGENTTRTDKDTALLSELEFLKNRKYDDIIIIDDVRFIGKVSKSGREGSVYLPHTCDWSHVTDDKIKLLLKKDYIILKDTTGNPQYSDGTGNNYILAKNKKF
jgi:hypothetical protein